MGGGARRGAGRPGWNIKVESLLHIDTRWASIRRLTPGNRYSCRWRRDGEEVGSMVAEMPNDAPFVLQIRFSSDEADGQDFYQTIRLTHTPCHYGGQRLWFRCPHCGRRAAKLYLLRGRWYCRQSFNATYASRSMGWIDRVHRRIAKLENRLAEDSSRPRGMHRRTYNRIIEQLEEAEDRLLFAFNQKAAKILKMP